MWEKNSLCREHWDVSLWRLFTKPITHYRKGKTPKHNRVSSKHQSQLYYPHGTIRDSSHRVSTFYIYSLWSVHQNSTKTFQVVSSKTDSFGLEVPSLFLCVSRNTITLNNPQSWLWNDFSGTISLGVKGYKKNFKVFCVIFFESLSSRKEDYMWLFCIGVPVEISETDIFF